jgi:TRAP-type C4-dicarboxylate transport system permease small subunit
MDALLRAIETVTDWVSGWLMAWSIFVLMILVLAEVVMRYLVNQPLSVAEEYGGYLLVAMTMIGLAFTWKEKGHINVDLLFNRLPAGVQRRLRLFTLLLAAALTVLLVAAGVNLVSQSFLFGTRSGSWLRTPLAWPQMILVLGSALLVLQLFAEIVKQLRALRGEGGER